MKRGLMISPALEELASFEAAHVVRRYDCYSPAAINGLVQTAAYAHAVSGEHTDAAGLRLVRRDLALERGTPMSIILEEGALLRNYGGGFVHREQLEYLLALPEQHPQVVIQVLPLASGYFEGRAGGGHTLITVDGNEQPSRVFYPYPYPEEAVLVTDQVRIQVAAEHHAALAAAALTPRLSATLIEALAS
jgi:hypothetical protein